MAPLLHLTRPNRCVACLVLAAGVTLGAAGGARADLRPSDAAEPVASSAAAPSSAVSPAAGSPSASPPGASPAPPSTAPGTSAPAPAPSATRPSGVPGLPTTSGFPGLPGLPGLPGGTSAAPSPSASVSPAGRPAPGTASRTPLAGREAGEGRPRPGRTLSPREIAEADQVRDEPSARQPEVDPAAASAFPSAAASAQGERLSRQALEGPSVQQVKQVSLGAGIALIGLGLGFLGLRLRRSN